jgi:replicative DNA helicase
MVKTGFKEIDYFTIGGLLKGGLIIIGSRPGVGKSALALSFVKNSAIKYGNMVAIFSLEMKKDEVLGRLISGEAKIEINRVISGKIQEDEWEKLKNAFCSLANAKIFINDSSGLTPSDIRHDCIKTKTQLGNLDMVVIDYLQLMKPDINSKKQDRELEISDILKALKLLAEELEIPIVVLSQLGSNVDKREDKRILLSDFNKSTSIEKEADIVMLLCREEVYDLDSVHKNEAELIISKNRYGNTGAFKLKWDKQYLFFESLDQMILL